MQREKIKALYLELNKKYIIERIKNNLTGKGSPKGIESKLTLFEKENKTILQSSYIYNLRKNKKEYLYLLTMFNFFKLIDSSFLNELETELGDNRRIVYITQNSLILMTDLFYKGKQNFIIKQQLISDIEVGKIFDSTDKPVLKDEVIDELLAEGSGIQGMEKYVELTKPDVDLSKIVLYPEVRKDIELIIKRYKEFKRMVKNGKFKKEIRGVVPVILFHGYPGTGKTITAHGIAKALNLPVARIKVENSDFHYSFIPILPRILEYLNRIEVVILINEFDKELDSSYISDLLEGLEISKNLMILTSNSIEVDFKSMALLRRITYRINFPIPDTKLRKKLWLFHLPEGYKFSNEIDINKIAQGFLLTGGNIKNIMLNYIMMYGDKKVIQKENLYKLINEEIKYNFEFAFKNFKQIYTDGNFQIKIKNNFFEKVIKNLDKIIEKKERMIISVYGEKISVEEFAKWLSRLCKKFILLELPEKEGGYNYEDKRKMKKYFYSSIREQIIVVVKSKEKSRRDNTNPKIESEEELILEFINEKFSTTGQKVLIVYTESKRIFKFLQKYSELSFVIKQDESIEDRFYEIEEDREIKQFIEENFAPGDREAIRLFLNYIEAYKKINRGRITFEDMRKIKQETGIREAHPILFG